VRKLNFGLDAPNIFRNLLITSGILATLLILSMALPPKPVPEIVILRLCLTLLLFSCLIPSLLMIASSKYFKIKNRDKLIRQLALTGSETVLDVGCGRGLYTIGFAMVLPNGKVCGIDIWNPEDISSNSENGILRNIRQSGLENRIRLKTEDMRRLSFENGSFDVVVASFSIHNINNAEERKKALSEIARVTKNAGRAVIVDFQKTGEYKEYYLSNGFKLEHRSTAFGVFPTATNLIFRKS